MYGSGWKSLGLFCFMLTVELCVCGEYTLRATNYGKVRGTIERVYGHKEVERFLGIPYASPPIGKLRLEPPEPPSSWGDSVYDATELSPACTQTAEGVGYNEHHVPGFNRTSEDCLYLNIYVPRRRHVSRSMPVLVFIHGGSYRNGMGAIFDGSALATHGIVVVTFNYRLGLLGFLTAVDDVIPGNYGMLDMVQALKWVQQNIAHFNGDPTKVTIDGHSAGGCSVGLLLLSPLAKGLFNQVIQQSGSPLAHWSVARYQTKPNFFFKMFARAVNCHGNTSQEVKRCMQSLDSSVYESLIFDQFEINEWSYSLLPKNRPVLDGYFLPKTPEEIMEKGELNAHRFMTGTTKDEGLLAAIPLVKWFGTGSTGMKRFLQVLSCFSGDLPDIRGIVDAVLERYMDSEKMDIAESEIESIFSEIVGDYFITAPTHLMADALSKRNVSVYVYSYEYWSLLSQWKGFEEISLQLRYKDDGVAKLLQQTIRTVHGSELFYLSGYPFTGHKNFRYDEQDKNMAKLLILMWSNFIKYGVPSLHPKQEMALPRYTSDRKLYTRIFSKTDPTISIGINYKQDRMTFWNKIVPEMYVRQFRQEQEINISYNTGDLNEKYFAYSANKNTWILISVCICLSVLTLALTVGYYKTRREVSRLLRQNSISSGERMLQKI